MTMTMSQHAANFARGVTLGLAAVAWLAVFHGAHIEASYAPMLVVNATALAGVFEAVKRPPLWLSLTAVVLFTETGLLVASGLA